MITSSLAIIVAVIVTIVSGVLNSEADGTQDDRRLRALGRLKI